MSARSVVVAGLARQQDPAFAAVDDDARQDRADLAAGGAGVREQRVDGGERRELPQVRERGEDERELVALVGLERRRPARSSAGRRTPRRRRAAAAPSGAATTKKCVSKRIAIFSGVIQRL